MERIRRSCTCLEFTSNSTSPAGRPLRSYYLPELYAASRYLFEVNAEQIAVCKNESKFRDDVSCDTDIYQLCMLYMNEESWDEPDNIEDALLLYRNLRRSFHADLFV